MQARELPAFKREMQELAECLPGRPLTTAMLEVYFDVLKPFPLEVIHRACIAIVGETTREQFFPKAAEIKLRCLGLMQEDAAEARAAHRAPAELRCQHREWDAPRGEEGKPPQCPARLPWPPEKDTEGQLRYYCSKHRPVYRLTYQPATVAERQALARTLPPAVRAFLRDAVPVLMAGVPRTPDEADAGGGRGFTLRLMAERQHLEGQLRQLFAQWRQVADVPLPEDDRATLAATQAALVHAAHQAGLSLDEAEPHREPDHA